MVSSRPSAVDQCCRQPSSSYQARDEIRQAGDFGRSKYYDIGIDAQLGQLQDAIVVDVFDPDQAELAPRRDPFWQFDNRRADKVVIDLPLGEDRVGRRRQVEQQDEKQRPEHGAARGGHTGRGVVTRQHLRQTRIADHQYENQRDEVIARIVAALLRARGKCLRVRYGRLRALHDIAVFAAPLLARASRIGGQGMQLALDTGDLPCGRIGILQGFQLRGQTGALGLQRHWQSGNTLPQVLCAEEQDAPHLLLRWRCGERFFLYAQALQHASVRQLRHRYASGMPRHHDDRCQVRNDW